MRTVLASALLISGFGLCGPVLAVDWTGVWVIADSPMDKQDGTSTFSGGRQNANSNAPLPPSPVLTEEYLQRRQKMIKTLQEAEKAGKYLDIAGADCRPLGMPRFWLGPYAFEIIQHPRQINLYQEAWQQTRRIYLDGRGHPSLDDSDPQYQGHSIGHWEGDVLVVDTTNISVDAKLTFDGIAEHSDAMHIVERFTEAAANLIEVQMTVEDPKALKEPWVTRYRLRRKPDLEAGDYLCTQNNRNRVDEEGNTTIQLGK